MISKSSKYFLLATFITKIGNGLYVLTISMLLYNLTQNVLAFGVVFISEFIYVVYTDWIVAYPKLSL